VRFASPSLRFGEQNRKIFVSLIEKNFGGARLKNVKKIFLFCLPADAGIAETLSRLCRTFDAEQAGKNFPS
jgi:hypothetical protein